MSDKRVSTQSLIEIKIRVPTGVYGPECTMQQIVDQAAREGLHKAIALVHGKGVVVGQPKVITVTTDEEKGLFDGIFSE